MCRFRMNELSGNKEFIVKGRNESEAVEDDASKTMSVDAVPEVSKVSDCEEQVGVVVAGRTMSLPPPVPCVESSAPAKTFSLPQQSIQHPRAVSFCAYPHLDLPDAPEYFFSDKMVFTPNSELLVKLVDMGITEMVATKALYWTGNSCIKRACSWIFAREEETLDTPLEVEIRMLKSDLEIKEEEVRERIKSIDSGICMMGDGDDDLDGISLDYEDLDVYKLVLVVNKSFNFHPKFIAHLVGRATGHMMAEVGMLEEGDHQQEMWEACGEQVVLHEGKNTGHLLDLRLAAQCLGLQWVEEGRFWDKVIRRYREVAVLGIWGLEEKLDMVVGRIDQMK